MCSELSEIPNGDVTRTGLSVGSVATYICISGFQLVGSPTRLCGDDATWSGGEPFCRRKYILSTCRIIPVVIVVEFIHQLNALNCLIF